MQIKMNLNKGGYLGEADEHIDGYHNQEKEFDSDQFSSKTLCL